MTHKELVEIGKKWLWSRCDIVVTELTTGISETPDVIGWKSNQSILIECKTNRQDFLNDNKKFIRRMPEYGVGGYRYYLMPDGIIKSIKEIPEKWGLLVIGESGKVHIAKTPQLFIASVGRLAKEMAILISCIKRIGQNPPENISVRAYKYKTKCRASIGVEETNAQFNPYRSFDYDTNKHTANKDRAYISWKAAKTI